MAERGTVLDPTLGNVVTIIHKGPALEMPSAEMVAAEEPAIFERMRVALELGVRFALGSECGGNEAHTHGSNVDELACYVRCGMSASDAIRSATLDAARAMWLDGAVASIAPGKLADLVIVDGPDPLDDVTALRTGIVAVVQGRRVVRDDLGLLDDLRRAQTTAGTTGTAVVRRAERAAGPAPARGARRR
jgi:imidazolonepropionase-like amidohydrolase